MVLFIILLVSGAALMGYGATAMDFAFNNMIWARSADNTGNFVVGTLSPEEGFYAGAGSTVLGFLFMLAAFRVGIINASTIRTAGYIVAGVLLMSWGVWGIGWSFYAAEDAANDDRVHVPCPTPNAETCKFTYWDWFLINAGLLAVGFFTVLLAIKKSRFTTIRA